MLKWISSMIAPKDAIVEANGTLIEYSNGQTPITVYVCIRMMKYFFICYYNYV